VKIGVTYPRSGDLHADLTRARRRQIYVGDLHGLVR